MKKIKHYYGVWYLQKLGIAGKAISNRLLFASENPSERLIRHETAHVMQYRRLSLFKITFIGFLIFLLRYVFEFIFGLVCYRSFWTAHRRISFEWEARHYEKEEKFSDINYIFLEKEDMR